MRQLLLLSAIASPGLSLDNGVGRTPALGWSTWNVFEDDISDALIRGIADKLVSTGLRDVGFVHVNLDAGAWLPDRAADGGIVADPKKFPHGMKSLADYIHSKNLKLGLYTDLSNRSADVGFVCGTGPGSYGHYKQDMQTFADFGLDYLKVDYCPYDHQGSHVPSIETEGASWADIRDALNETGRPVYLYSCPRSWTDGNKTQVHDEPPLDWSGDKRASLANSMLTEFHNSKDEWSSMLSNLDAVVHTTNLSYSKPGFWQDADLLHTCEFGHSKKGPGMSLAEYTANFATWSILASQMILSVDIRRFNSTEDECLKLLLNSEIVAVNQDPAGHPPQLVYEKSDNTPSKSTITAQCFSRLLHDGSTAVVLLNRGESTSSLGVTWEQLGVQGKGRTCVIRDLISQKDAGTSVGGFNVTIGRHSATMITIKCI